jgi:hypothetical protein
VKILVFAPYASIYPHAAIESDLAKNFINAGHEVTFLRCGRILEFFCTNMRASGLSLDSDVKSKFKVCGRCEISSRSESFLTGSKIDFLQHWAEPIDNDVVDEILSHVSKENWFELEYDGIPIGRLSAYETLLQNKLVTLEVNEEQWIRLRVELANSIRLSLAARRYFDQKAFDRLIVYNNFYGVNRTLTHVASRHRIPIFSIQANGFNHEMYQSISILVSDEQAFLYPHTRSVRDKMTLPLNSSEVQSVTRHLEGLLNSSTAWVYSTAVQKFEDNDFILKMLELSAGRQIILLALSSADEMFAARAIGVNLPNLVNNEEDQQLKSIDEIINYFSLHTDKFLIIRPHPREFPNKRDSVVSEHGLKLRQLLSHVPSNVLINWPEDSVSIYNFIPHASLLINNSSSVGLEFSALGVPILSLDPERLYAYPPIVGNTIGPNENLSQSISRILNEQESPLHQVLAFRYINVSRFSGIFQETDNLHSTARKVLFMYRRLISRLGVARIPFFVGYLRKQLGLKANRGSIGSVSGVDFIIDGARSSSEIANTEYFEYSYEFSEMELVQNSVLALKESYGLD